MDRLSVQMDQGCEDDETPKGAPAIPLGQGVEPLVTHSRVHAAIPDALYELNELECLYDADQAALWTFMRTTGRPSFNPGLLNDFVNWQGLIAGHFGEGKVPLRYLVLGSRAPGVFCYGGDLKLFQTLIRNGDREGLVRYGYSCVEILERNMKALDLPMLTVGLVQGAALGGGFEALLSFDYIIAERDASFGLPEVLFGLFPGMGAHAFLSRKLGTAMAQRLITSNETYTAEQMYDLGIVHQLAEPGDGIEACRDFIAKSQRRHGGLVNAQRAMRIASPIELDELKRITELWADAALQLREQDLKVMSRLVAAQSRMAEKAEEARA